jgi:hypothetical protein
MPGWLESLVELTVGSIAVLLVFRYPALIATHIAALLEALGLPFRLLVTLTRKRAGASQSGLRSLRPAAPSERIA